MTTFMSSQNAFPLALEAYQAKRFEEASAHCRTVLETEPDHAAALHLLGFLEFCFGHREDAEVLMRKAVTLKPGFPEVHYHFAQVLTANGKPAEALEHYEKTVATKPSHAQAFFCMGNAHALLGHRPKAAEAYEKAIAANPEYPEALNNLGVHYYEKGESEKAIDLYERAIALKPAYAAAHSNLGNIYKERSEWDKAIACYRTALQNDPNLTQALNNLGLALMDGTSDIPGARTCFKQILSRNPNDVTALTHMGLTYCIKGAFSEALEWYEKALALEPSYRDALNDKGSALKALCRVEEALSCYERAKEMTPNDPDIHINIAMTLLELGRFDEGWHEYEWRWQTTQLKSAKRHFTQPQWHGEEGQSRTLLIHAEQGFGDTIQFCRYAPLAAQRGWKVVLEVQPELLSLMKSLKGVDAAFVTGQTRLFFDTHCPMMSLPLAFNTTLETVPANIPYLSADQEKVASWAARIPKTPGTLKVGLVWTGNPRLFSTDLAAANERRSLTSDALAPLCDLKNIQFYSLQKNGFPLTSAPYMIDFMPECADFADTAALISNLDLVISVDTSVAHLAGAMGKPVWLLNRFDTCWRWLLDRQDTPWYPTMKIFRQPSPGDWASVIAEVKHALASQIPNPESPSTPPHTLSPTPPAYPPPPESSPPQHPQRAP